jgi:hypothetical protein
MLEVLPGEPLAFPDDVPERFGKIPMLVREIDNTLVDRVSQPLGVQAFKSLFSPT